tara:strand:- start:2205 stop:2645 length:441 start_codon:yes stop_codon:yes gene_type:complete
LHNFAKATAMLQALTTKQKYISACAGAAMSLGALTSPALADDVKVADVLSMDSTARSTFIMNTASDRIVQIGQAYGDDPLKCLSKIFTQARVVDGQSGLSLGHRATLQFLTRANGRGKGDVAAQQAINLVVDSFAKQKCAIPGTEY